MRARQASRGPTIRRSLGNNQEMSLPKPSQIEIGRRSTVGRREIGRGRL